jgi:hypothetical protein
MNIIEAIKSGKNFRRPGVKGWLYVDVFKCSFKQIDWESLIADDWEVEEKPVTITKEEFEKAWKSAIENSKRAYDPKWAKETEDWRERLDIAQWFLIQEIFVRKELGF